MAIKVLSPSHTVIIDAPIDVVWEYASDSSKANEWSVFFDHISSLPGIEDGRVGSLRRCYRFEDETGPTWDEEVMSVEPLKKREIRTFNLKEFKLKGIEGAEFEVFQNYEKVNEKTSKLTFSSSLKNPYDVVMALKVAPLGLETERVFKANLENIKEAIESRYRGEVYNRPHPFEPKNKMTDK